MEKPTLDEQERVQTLHLEFIREIRPLLQADGRNSVLKVSMFLASNVRSSVPFDEMAQRIILACRSSRKIALQIWMSDLKKLHGEQLHEKLVHIIRHYSTRAAFTEREKHYYEQLREAEVSETYGIQK